MKDAFYFSHDSNARHDPKLIAFIEECGIAGHAYFFILIEILREQKNYIFPKYLVNALAKEWQTHGTAITPQNILDSMVKLQLIAVNEEGYYSPSLCQRMEYFEDIKKKRSDAGKAGAKALWQTHGKRMAKDGKEREEKRRKEKNNPVNQKDFPFFENETFSTRFNDFLEMRVKIRKPATERAKTMILADLHKHSVEIATAMLEQAIRKSWQDVYPLKSTRPLVNRKAGLTPEQMRIAH